MLLTCLRFHGRLHFPAIFMPHTLGHIARDPPVTMNNKHTDMHNITYIYICIYRMCEDFFANAHAVGMHAHACTCIQTQQDRCVCIYIYIYICVCVCVRFSVGAWGACAARAVHRQTSKQRYMGLHDARSAAIHVYMQRLHII